jgi:hypothetical protein
MVSLANRKTKNENKCYFFHLKFLHILTIFIFKQSKQIIMENNVFFLIIENFLSKYFFFYKLKCWCENYYFCSFSISFCFSSYNLFSSIALSIIASQCASFSFLLRKLKKNNFYLSKKLKITKNPSNHII